MAMGSIGCVDMTCDREAVEYRARSPEGELSPRVGVRTCRPGHMQSRGVNHAPVLSETSTGLRASIKKTAVHVAERERL